MPICPRCKKDLECLPGCSAHPSNWYCKECGWPDSEAVAPPAKPVNPSSGCARFCEANAYQIEIRNLKHRIKELEDMLSTANKAVEFHECFHSWNKGIDY